MSKAEDKANKRYGITRGDDTQETSGIDMQRASDFIDGYRQAEEDIIEWIKNNWREYINTDKDGVVCFGHWENELRKYIEEK